MPNENPDILVGNTENTISQDLKILRIKNMNKLIIAHLNINSLRNKFVFLKEAINNNVDILVITERKLDESFPKGQFVLDGFSTPYRLDRNCHGGGILMFIREDIPSKLLSVENNPVEGFYVEINLHKN